MLGLIFGVETPREPSPPEKDLLLKMAVVAFSTSPVV